MKKIILLFTMLLCNMFYAQNIKHVNAEEFKKLIDGKKGILIDLRTDDEMNNKGFIKGATQLNWLAKDNEQQVAKLDKNKVYLIYCAAGGRSGDAAEYMKSQGFKEVVNLEKGFDDWKRKGMPVEMKK